MADIEPDEAQLAEWEDAAEERYKSLRTHIFVELGHVCSFPHISKAADTTAEAVRGELVKVFVAYLAACDQRDRLAKRLKELEAERDCGVLEYLRTHPEHTAELMRAESGRLAQRNTYPRATIGDAP